MFNQSINYMKRKTTFLAKAFTMLFAVLLSLVTSGAAAQETLTVYEDGEATSAYVPVYGFYGDAFNKCEFIIPSDELASMINGTISQMAFYLSSPATESWGDAQFQVFLKEVSETTLADFTGAEGATIVYEGALDGTGETMTIDFTSSYTYGGGNLLVGVYQTVKGSYKSASFYGVTAEGASITGYNYSGLDGIAATARNFIPKTTFAYTGGSFDGVLKPTGLKVSYEGGTEATISWSSEEEVFDIDVNGTVTENVENPTTLTGLEYATVYTVKVRAKRGEKMSDWSNPVTFTTAISDDMCQIQAVLTDSYGDGWSSAKLVITDVESGIEIASLTLASGLGPETIAIDVPNNHDIKFTWVSGNQLSYENECGFVITDINDQVILAKEAGSQPAPTAGVLETWHVNCAASPWRSPADLAASEITAFSATLSWTERSLNPATSWVLAYAAAGAAEYTEVTVTENPYVLEGLTPETTYAVKVRPATDEVEFWSDEITFTTDVQFRAVQDLAVEPTATTATVTWTPAEGATSYVLEYADPSSVTFVGDWYKYDNGTASSGVSAGGEEFNYAVMFPAGSFTGNALNKVSIFDAAAATGTVIIYAGGTTEPETVIASSPYTLTASNEFVDVNFNYITVNPEQNLWVVVTNPSGATVATADDELGDANGRWLYYGNWGDLANAGVSGSCWLIHAEIGTADFSSVTWTTVEGATSPAEIAGLTPETDYLVRVKAIYGEEGESAWTSTNFTTAEEVATPTDLAVSEVGNKSAVLSWTENGEATAWQIALNGDEENLIAADSNPFTLTGLTPETAYTAKVRAINGEKQSKWSNEVSFTTDIAYPAPTELAAEAASTDATITWTGDADSYNLRYRVYVPGNEVKESFEEELGDWTTIDADGDGQTWYGLTTAQGAFTPHDGEAFMTSASYQNAALTPDNYLVSPKVKLGGSITFWACAQDASWAAEHFGVAVSTTGNTDAADFTTIEEWTMTSAGTPASSRRKVQGTWGEYTVDLSAYAGQEGYVAIRHFNCSDMFRLNVDDVTITMPGEGEEQPWTVVENATSPYTIEGLDEDTKYEVAVQAVYADGESQWATTTFTTLNNNPVPYDIVADLTADGANLTWEGNGENYVVRYRVPNTYEATFFEDFENGMPEDWTTIDADGDGNDWGVTQGVSTVSGTNAAISQSYINNVGALTPDNWLITPKLDLDGTMRVWLCGQDPNYPSEHFAIYLAPVDEVADVSDFTITLVPETVTTGEYVEYTADLSAYAGQQGYIAIRHFNCSDMFYLNVDDFGLYVESDEQPWTEIVTNDPEATISGLATNNAYEYQIKSIKGENESEWSELGEFALVTLDCNGDNTDLLNKFNGKLAHVTLANRTFYKDDTWNTIFLPFDLTEEEFAQTPLADGELRTLTDIDYDEENDIVTLNFDEAMGMYADYGYPGMVGGNPYIIKWAAGSNVENPEFANVTISNAQYYTGGATDDESIEVQFYGTYDWMEFPDTDQSFLFLGADNTLYYPEGGASVAATRGFFYLTGVTAGEGEGVKFCTNLDGANDPTGIANLNVEESGEWYDLSGRKLAGKPVQKGIYVNGGRKVTVK